MKYKIGDFVTIKNKSELIDMYGDSKYCDYASMKAQILRVDPSDKSYQINIDNRRFCWYDSDFIDDVKEDVAQNIVLKNSKDSIIIAYIDGKLTIYRNGQLVETTGLQNLNFECDRLHKIDGIYEVNLEINYTN